MQKLKKSIILFLSFVMVLSVGFVANAGQSDAVTYSIQGYNYSFKESVHSPAFTWSGNGTMKITYNASCDYGVQVGGYWEVRLQKKVNGVWTTVRSQVKDQGCTTYKRVDTRSFGTVSSSGTYRVQFKRVSKSGYGNTGYVYIHYFGVYRG